MDGYLPLPNGTRNATMNSAYGVETRAEIDKLVQFNNLSEGKDAQSDIKYRMPVTFGASLRFDLSDDWAVETGVTYTQLSSETRWEPKNNYGWEEKLYYVGIPLKVNRNIWSNKRFEVYALGRWSGRKMCVWKAEHYRQCFYIKCRKKMNSFREGRKMSK